MSWDNSLVKSITNLKKLDRAEKKKNWCPHFFLQPVHVEYMKCSVIIELVWVGPVDNRPSNV